MIVSNWKAQTNYALDNARVTHGTDQSTNVVNTSTGTVFNDMRQVILQHAPADQKAELTQLLESVQQAKTKADASDRWNKWMETASKTVNVMTAAAPLIAKVYGWMHGLP